MKGNKSGVEQSYAAWISALKRRYRATQIKAAQNGWSRNSFLNWLSTDLGLPMGITDYELKKVLPTKAQLAKCVADAERQVEMTRKGGKG